MNRDDVEREIRGALAVFCELGDVIELRAPKAGRDGTISGYYDALEALTSDALRLDARGDLPGIYVTPNPVDRALLVRVANYASRRVARATADGDVIARRWLPIDFDPARAARVSSTDAEHNAALALARRVHTWLVQLGIPPDAIVLADSGNGAHLLVRIGLPNDGASTDLCRRCLAALDLRFSSDVVHVDTTTYNAARIWKLYGTFARKGESTQERPHRRARVLAVPDRIVVAGRAFLERLAAEAPAERKQAPASEGATWDRAPRAAELRGGRFDLPNWIRTHGLAVVRQGPWQDGGRKWILSPCPFNPEHTDSAAYVVQHANGAIAAGCHHNGCADKGWFDLRAYYGRAGLVGVDSRAVHRPPSVSSGEDQDDMCLQRLALQLRRNGWSYREILSELRRAHRLERPRGCHK